MRALLLSAVCWMAACAQYQQGPYQQGPAPARLHISGAVPVGPPGRAGYRQARLQLAPVGPVRLRRPGPARPSFKSVDVTPRLPLQSLEDFAKPVTEEPEDELEANTPTGFPLNSYSTPEPPGDYYDVTTTSQPKPPSAFNPSPFNASPYSPPAYQQPTPPAFRPEPPRPTQYRPLAAPTFAPARGEPSKPPARLQPLSARPQRPSFRPEPRPLLEEDPEPVRQYSRPQEPARAPKPQKYVPANPKEKKPVAQILRKYREENEDGSITWGFENDDGSFKEETIGMDCVTRGKYGYVDPDGVKREYNYETGILCDKNRKDDEEEKGYIDYQENKAVLPNGITVDLNAMGKKSKRPFRSPQNH